MKYSLLAIALLVQLSLFSQGKFTISGTISDAETGESLIGAAIMVDGTHTGTVTNVYGFYSLTLPQDTYSLSYGFIGYTKIIRSIDLSSNQKIDVELSPSSITIGMAEVQTEKDAVENVESVEMSKVRMSMDAIRRIPAFMGEVDVIKAIQMLPGVQTVGEGNSGFYVRGGAVDQNLILLDEGTVYNASHLLGFFSVFNSDAIKDVQLYKGGIPARYGGRLSSVLDIRMKEGNSKKFSGAGGVGTVSSRLTLESPYANGRGSFLVSGRRTYADVFTLLSKKQEVRDTKLYFYDLNLKANYKLSDNDHLYLSGYFGRDVSGFGDLFGIEWGNATGTVRWNHIYNERLFSNVTFIYSNFDYLLKQEIENFGFRWESYIKDLSVKADYNYFLNPTNTIRFGVSAIKHKIDPGYARGTGDNSMINDIRIPLNNAMEYGAYLSNEHTISDRLTAIYGLRYSLFQNIGEGTYWNYDAEYNPTDSLHYGKNDVYNTYGGLEPRLGLNYRLDKTSSVKASYNRTIQYIHLASNSTVSSPLDVWFSSSPNVKPQKADQVAAGYFRNFLNDQIELSAEVYYKTMQNAIDFADHAQLLLNKHLEGELRFGKARSYGLELMLRKQEGRFTGLISYTLSRTERLIEDISLNWYPTKYDKTHDVSILGSYTLTDRWSFGANWVYSTGAAVTMPTGRFEFMGELVPVYSDRNGARMPAYHRLDLSATLQGKKNETRKWNGEWVFSIYNAYYRKNPYSINFVQDKEDPTITHAEMTYLLPIIPAVTYNFNF
jgi:hypothetical protein